VLVASPHHSGSRASRVALTTVVTAARRFSRVTKVARMWRSSASPTPCSPVTAICRMPMLVPSANSTSSSRRFRVARSSTSRLATEANESVKPVMNAVSFRMSSRSMVPHRRSTSAFSAPRFLGSGSLPSLGTLTHGLPCRVMIRTPPLVSPARAVSSRVSPSSNRFRSPSTNCAASSGLARAE
jgi:hypothetical protein